MLGVVSYAFANSIFESKSSTTFRRSAAASVSCDVEIRFAEK